MVSFDRNINIKDFNISFTNTVNKKPVKEIDTYVKYLKYPKQFSLDYLHTDLKEFLSLNKGISVERNIIIFSDNQYNINVDNLNMETLPQFGLFWGKYYNYRDSYNYDQWNLKPNEFTSIGVTRIFNRKERLWS